MADDTQIPAHAGQGQLSHTPFNTGMAALLAMRRGELEACRHHFLHGPGNGEALHNLRVAVRRMRSLLGGYRRYLQGTKAIGSELRALTQASNAARDLEVFIALIEKSGATTAPLLPPLQQQLDEQYSLFRERLPEAWQRLGPLLESIEGLVAPDATSKPLGKVCHREAKRHTRRLKKGLKRLKDKWNDEQAHGLRIIGKRLRYLLEPFAESGEVAQAVSALKRFQDCLGDYHDSDLLQQRLAAWHPTPPLDSAQVMELEGLVVQLQGRHRQLRRDIREGYLRQGRKPFLRQLKSALHSLLQ